METMDKNTNTNAQHPQELKHHYRLTPPTEDETWTWTDDFDEDDEFRIITAYHFIDPERNDALLRMRNKNGKWGFVDKAGKLIIPFIWNYTDGFCNGIAPVENDEGKWGLIDQSGQLVCPVSGNISGI